MIAATMRKNKTILEKYKKPNVVLCKKKEESVKLRI